jgi:metal-responsive CopG/Arc/MetJ family transcriptional regulator
MKTAISLPDDLFAQAEEFARKSGKSRSEVFREALAEYLLRRDAAAVTSAMDDVLAAMDQPPDEWSARAARRALERSEW